MLVLVDEVVSGWVAAPSSIRRLPPQHVVTICGNQASMEAPDGAQMHCCAQHCIATCTAGPAPAPMLQVSAAVSLLWPNDLQAVPCL